VPGCLVPPAAGLAFRSRWLGVHHSALVLSFGTGLASFGTHRAGERGRTQEPGGVPQSFCRCPTPSRLVSISSLGFGVGGPPPERPGNAGDQPAV
jgi:hypothetical protein